MEKNKLHEAILDLRSQVDSEDFKGFSIDAQRELIGELLKMYEHNDYLYKEVESSYKKSIDYLHKYNCWSSISNLSFWKRLHFLFNPYSISWNDVKDFDK